MLLGMLIGAGVAGGAGAIAYPEEVERLQEKLGLNKKDPAFVQCEQAVKKALKSPSSYRRELFVVGLPGEPNAVGINYEAKNSFGVSLAGAAKCTFEHEPDPSAVRYPHVYGDRKGAFRMSGVQINGAALTGIDLLVVRPAGRVEEGETELKRAGS